MARSARGNRGNVVTLMRQTVEDKRSNSTNWIIQIWANL